MNTMNPNGSAAVGATLGAALIGLGKISGDQHVPALRASSDFALLAGADPKATIPDLAHFTNADQMLRDVPDIRAVSICTPPRLRFALARMALLAGKHVLLEKPPCATLSELAELHALAGASGLTLFTAWHSRYAAAVETARAWLAGRTLTNVLVEWKEDVRRWHPGQLWIWRGGGLGVFDPGINALSVLTHILPEPLRVQAALLDIPGNCATPTAAELDMRSGATPVRCEFDFLQTGPQTWSITIATSNGETLQLTNGGRALAIDGKQITDAPNTEYPMMYAHFATLIAQRQSFVDDRPLRLTADALLVAEQRRVEDFIE